MSHSCMSTLESSPRPSLHISMADLVLQFTETSDSGVALSSCAVDITRKKSLEESDIVNHGGNMYIGQFGLEENFFLRTDDTVKQMQSVLAKAFSLICGRPVCFVIDPHAEFMQTLRGTSGVDVLQVAWAALSKRMGIAELRFKQYDQEYQMQKNESMTYKSSHLATSSPLARPSRYVTVDSANAHPGTSAQVPECLVEIRSGQSYGEVHLGRRSLGEDSCSKHRDCSRSGAWE
ncbi:hypothetical protein K438DRAFT_1250595 [Mycena galopus ATCC 62051]|nr:hypothetical protein K438DRAFT_1250595 [Mycena galopus ATCC 62051]